MPMGGEPILSSAGTQKTPYNLSFEYAFQALKKGGLFAFTMELPGDEIKSFRLNPNSRYAHSGCYAESALHSAGFSVRTSRSLTLRTEGGEPVNGLLLVAEKALF